MTLLPANIDLAGCRGDAVDAGPVAKYALKTARWAKIGGKFDVVIIDCPPSLGGGSRFNGADRGRRCDRAAAVRKRWRTAASANFCARSPTCRQITNSDLKLLGALPTLYDARHHPQPRPCLLDVADRYDMPVLGGRRSPRTVRVCPRPGASGRVGVGQQEETRVALRVSRIGLRAAQALEERQGAGHLHARALGTDGKKRGSDPVDSALHLLAGVAGIETNAILNVGDLTCC